MKDVSTAAVPRCPSVETGTPDLSAEVYLVGKIKTIAFRLAPGDRDDWAISEVSVVSPVGSHIAEPMISCDRSGGRHVVGNFSLAKSMRLRPKVSAGQVVFYAEDSDILRAQFTLVNRNDPGRRETLSRVVRNRFC